jgi:hypothetical protein
LEKLTDGPFLGAGSEGFQHWRPGSRYDLRGKVCVCRGENSRKAAWRRSEWPGRHYSHASSVGGLRGSGSFPFGRLRHQTVDSGPSSGPQAPEVFLEGE